MAVKCDNHPEASAVGRCINCGKAVCIECKVVLGGDTYCTVCADKLFIRRDRIPELEPRARYVNWFEEHLNLTLLIAWGIAFLISFITGFILAYLKPDITERQLELIGFAIGVIVLMPVGAWILQKKNRSPGWLILLIIPFGFIVFLLLENRGKKKASF